VSEGLDEVELSLLTNLLHDSYHLLLIYGVFQVIGDERLANLDIKLNIDLERMRRPVFFFVDAVGCVERNPNNGKPDGIRPARRDSVLLSCGLTLAQQGSRWH